ncbi:hypothetical protein BVG16_23255 [Paenibacillus selenitireducens]|uniref:Uncharacterized protein n=1 Tax=Paenibacillus selenitireducens TaxID=1324314 RepID=A0A1T2X479_9BACL|nr:hypothetical protein [Paenibacillus selenitireducens]OPA74679.1 hypothetical protein BVG16_23255 [Paenibacillus selenitireducens]
MRKEIEMAIARKQSVSLSVIGDKPVRGIPEKIGPSGLVTIRSTNEVQWIPLSDIKHVSRVIEMKRVSE